MQRYKETRRITLIGGALDLALGILKIAVGKLSYSQSLVADGVHSLSDLVTDVLVIWAAKQASREPDADHPYGHQRIETVATMRIRSDLLRSNAWHSRSDALSSIVVIIGVGGSMIGISWLDAAAAVLVAVMIVYVAAGMIRQGVRELIDTGVDAEQLAAIREAVKKIEGVTDIHDLRTRRMGSDVFVDGHVLVDSKISVSEGHRIGDAVFYSLKTGFENITDITIHVDSEDDAAYQRSSHLPLRSEITAQLRESWQDIHGADSIERIVLHYIDGRIQIEVWVALSEFESLEQARDTAEKLRASCAHDEQIANLEVLFY